MEVFKSFPKIARKTVILAQRREIPIVKIVTGAKNKCITWIGETKNEYFVIHCFDTKVYLGISEREIMLPHEKPVLLGNVVSTVEEGFQYKTENLDEVFNTIVEFLFWDIKDPSKITDFSVAG